MNPYELLLFRVSCQYKCIFMPQYDCLYEVCLYPIQPSCSHLQFSFPQFDDTVSICMLNISVRVCVCGTHHHHHAIKQSILTTISPFHAKARAKWSFHAQTVKAIDLSYVIWNDFCVIISLVLCDPDRAWNEWVCVCVLRDDVPLFISDLSYATQVIQHARPMGGLHPGERVLLCLCDW